MVEGADGRRSQPEHHTRLDFPFAPVPEELLYDERVSATAVRIFGTLARHGLDPDSCFPDHDRIGFLLHMSGRSVARPLRELEETGWIERFPRFSASGRLSDGYLLHGSAQNCAANRAIGREPSAQISAVGSGEASLLEIEPVNESECLPAQKRAPSFDDFWALFPRKTGKGAARKAWAKSITRAHPDVILRGLVRYLDDPNRPDPEFVPHGATWLNQDRWEDGPEPERTGGKRPTPTDRTMANLGQLLDEGGGNGNGRRHQAADRGPQRGLPG